MTETAYDRLADEYYDPRHKTCRNFDQATKAAIAALPPTIPTEGLVLEVGCGRGRCGEFLRLPWSRIVQLDSSARMLELPAREPCLLKVHASAADVPLADEQFSAVVGFLVDPFLSLGFFSEAYRLLQPGGTLFVTTPAHEWGIALRGIPRPGIAEAVFLDQNNQAVRVSSILLPDARIIDMMCHIGFETPTIRHFSLPTDAEPISPDIVRAATAANRPVGDLPVVTFISSNRPG